MKKIKLDKTLYHECTPEQWAKETIKSLNLLPDLETIYLEEYLFNIDAHFKHTNRFVTFEIQTKNKNLTLRGVILDCIPINEKRNALDFLFIPEENMDQTKDKKADDILSLGHLINGATISNIKKTSNGKN